MASSDNVGPDVCIPVGIVMVVVVVGLILELLISGGLGILSGSYSAMIRSYIEFLYTNLVIFFFIKYMLQVNISDFQRLH